MACESRMDRWSTGHKRRRGVPDEFEEEFEEVLGNLGTVNACIESGSIDRISSAIIFDCFLSFPPSERLGSSEDQRGSDGQCVCVCVCVCVRVRNSAY
jgi:hypothetical protein